MKLLTGFAVVKDNVGNRIAYTTSEVDKTGAIVSSNNKESFVVLDPETNNLIEQLEEKIKERIKLLKIKRNKTYIESYCKKR
ncbi:hypothetical protein [Clostridium cuniculi]|uniref:hypothetical protein n=1 Tax=Clostridium cuniculi TaxID=2548455 RepID=UPI001054ECEB|nr:hypothetical protein [Clostridium cuniculi]